MIAGKGSLTRLVPTDSCRKYRYMESNSLTRRAGLEEKVPELRRTIAMVETLQRKKVTVRLTSTIELSQLTSNA